MAGILDNKTRILDTLISSEARRQSSSGRMQIKYVTFTDRHAFYNTSGSITGSATKLYADDAGDRIYFEASNRYQDLITPEVDFNGRLKLTTPMKANDEKGVYGNENVGNVFISEDSPDTLANGDDDLWGIQDMDLGLSSIDVGEAFVKRFVENFNEQNTIATNDPFNGPKNFVLSVNGALNNSISFDVTDIAPKIDNDWNFSIRQLNTVTPIYEDWKWEHEPNFDFLPPINKLTPGASMPKILPFIKTGANLKTINAHQAFKMISKTEDVSNHPFWEGGGMYTQWMLNQPDPATGVKPHDDPEFMDLFRIAAADFYAYDELGINDYTAARQVFMFPYERIWKNAQTTDPFKADSIHIMSSLNGYKQPSALIKSPETSAENNMVIQFFEVSEDGKLKKLSTVDYGEFRESFYSPLVEDHSFIRNTRIFFVGKMYQVDPEKDPAMRFCNIFTVTVLDTGNDINEIGG